MAKNIKHGHGASGAGRTPTYISWANMIARCHNKKNKRYSDYGGAGIFVCKRWRLAFANFLEDMGPKPDGYQIDRINNDGGYEPWNCRWVTPKQNMANRRMKIMWSVFGVEYPAARDAGVANGCSANTIAAWCKGRTAEGRYYPPRAGCHVRIIDAKGEKA